jgi:hypothetical protein
METTMTEDQLREFGLVPMIVARGKTVQTDVPGSGRPDPDDPCRVIDTTRRAHGPGETVWLLPADAERLRRLGFTLDPTRDLAQVEAVRITMLPPNSTQRVTNEYGNMLRRSTAADYVNPNHPTENYRE